MLDNPWPYHSRRKVILVLDQDDIADLYLDNEGSKLLDNEDVYLLASFPSQSDPVVQKLVDQGLVTAGAILIQNPFDKNQYHLESEAIDEISLAKWLHFSTLCGYLGAREVKVEQIKLNDRGREDKFKVKAGVALVAGGKVNVQNKSSALLVEHLSSGAKFVGTKPNIENAVKFLQQTGLSNDIIMQDLINKAKIDNPTQEYTFNLNLTNEAHQNLKILINLKSVIKIPIASKIKYNKKIYEKTKYSLTIAVKF